MPQYANRYCMTDHDEIKTKNTQFQKTFKQVLLIWTLIMAVIVDWISSAYTNQYLSNHWKLNMMSFGENDITVAYLIIRQAVLMVLPNLPMKRAFSFELCSKGTIYKKATLIQAHIERRINDAWWPGSPGLKFLKINH